MSITTIIRTPIVGQVGILATFVAAGTPVGTELRWYLASAPINSKLPTLETLDIAQYAKARLKVENDAAQLTPDVPGHYQIECHDVTVNRTLRKHDDAPIVPDTDNDFAGAPVVNLNTAEALSRYAGQPDYQAIQLVTRTLGQAPNSLTVSVMVRDDVESQLPAAADILAPASASQLAKFAQYDDAILGVRDLLREGRVRNNAAIHLNGSPHAVLQANLGRSLLFALQRWMGHLDETTTRNVHLVADNVNTVPATECVTLAECLARLAALRSAYTAHIASTTFHGSADTRNLFATALANPVDLVSGLAFARVAFQTMVHGPNETTEVQQDNTTITLFGHMILGGHATGNIQDPEGATSFDFSSTLIGLRRACNELTRLWNLHRVRVTQPAAHLAADTQNDIRAFGLIDSGSFGYAPSIDGGAAVSLVNQLAECIERHTADLKRDGTANVTIHQKQRPVTIGRRAGDVESAIAVLELCCAAMELHALDGGTAYTAHASKVWGATSGTVYFYSGITYASWPLMTRAQLYLRRYQLSAAPPVPAHMNALPPVLLGLGWR